MDTDIEKKGFGIHLCKSVPYLWLIPLILRRGRSLRFARQRAAQAADVLEKFLAQDVADQRRHGEADNEDLDRAGADDAMGYPPRGKSAGDPLGGGDHGEIQPGAGTDQKFSLRP